MHTGVCASHKGVPTAHCASVRSDDTCKHLKMKDKLTCLFFDQVNIYAKFGCAKCVLWDPSTDLSTDIVDKVASV